MNSREIAILLWLIVVGLIATFSKSFRNSLLGFLKVLATRKIALTISSMLLYIVGVVLALYHLNLWSIALIKQTIYWILLVGIVLLMNTPKMLEEGSILKKPIFDLLKITVILEFITNLYCFGIVLEFILLPIVLFAFLISEYASEIQNSGSAKKVADAITIFYGLLVMGSSTYHIAVNFSDIYSTRTLIDFLISPILTIAFLPFLYLFGLYMLYESTNTILKTNLKGNKHLQTRIIRIILIRCNFNLWRIIPLPKQLNKFLYLSIDEDEAIATTVSLFKNKPVANK